MLRNVLAILTFTCATLTAQLQSTFFASGLRNPSKIVLGPNGTLLVSEADTTPNSGRVSILTSAGVRRTVLDALPSGLSAPGNDVDGPSGLAVAGRMLYIAIGEGDTFRVGPMPRTFLANPTGPSSPIFSTILQVTFSNDLDKLTAGFALTIANQSTLWEGNTVTLENGAGDTATVRLLSQFPFARPDPTMIYKNTHLFGLTTHPAKPEVLYVVDAGQNAIWQVDIASGRRRLHTRFAPTPNSLPGPPVSEAVPTSIRVFNDQLLVSLLSGAPFAPGASRVMQVDPGSGNASPFLTDLTSAIDVIYRPRTEGRGEWYVLEFSRDLGSGAPGSLKAFNSPLSPIVLPNLRTPSSMALDEATGNLYITDRSGGTVSVVNIGK